MFRYLVGDLQDLDEHVCNNKAIKEAIKRIKPSDGNHDGACPISSRHHHTRRRRRLHLSQARAGAGVVLAFGVVLVSAVVVSGSASSPPPPPPPSLLSNNNNGRQQHGQQPQQDRWTGWTPPPPNPPPDHVARDGNGQGGGGGDDPSRTAAGATAGAAAEGLREGGRDGWGAGPAAGGQGAAAALEDESRVAGRSAGGGNYDVNGLNQGMMGGTAGRGEGQEHSHQLMHERMMMARQQQGQQGQQGQQPQQYHVQQQQHHPQQQQQPTPPPAWVSGASSRHDHQQGSPQRPQLEQFFDANDGGENIAHRTPPGGPPYPPSGMYRQGQVRVGMMGGAGDGVGSDGAASATAAGGGRWDPPPGASAGAITPEVKLSQYRQGAGAGAGAGSTAGAANVAGGVGEGEIARALLSNTDKEVIFDGLKKLYRKKILPLEESSRYAHFHSPPMNPADFEAKPMVLIVGQYSVGKTSFIRSLLKKDFPGQRVGPEPTTDRFVAVTHGDDERVMPGHALAMQADKPFRSLQQFGNNFLTKFEGSIVDAPILRNITLVDTPGVLSGEKQRIGRDYDFASVISWFAERADLIVVMFDAHKLDISDELKMVIDTLKPHHDKMRVLLNKADTIDTQQLMRVYGALMWSLGKVMQTPEVCRVYIGSFWEAPLSNFENRFLLEKEKNDLLDELMLLPENAVVRRINELVKRARSVKVHAYIIHYLRKQMPYMMGKQDKQEKLIRRLDQEFLACARRYGLPLGDFPKVEKFRRSLREIKDISKFKSLDKSLVHEMDKVFSGDIPKLMEKAARPGGR